MATFPKSYADPAYDSLDAANEQKYGIPVGMITALRVNGERTNADRVSSDGAKTPYQIIPETRDAILKKYGIDAYLSPDNASEAAAILQRDSLKRNGGDPEKAVREYHGGTDPANWGPINNAYWGRVSAGMKDAGTKALSDQFGQWLEANPASKPIAPAAESAKADPLSAAFGSWIAGTDRPPGAAVGRAPVDNLPAPATQPTPGVIDTLAGTGEAALNLGTGIVGGTLGMAGGLASGVAGAVMRGDFGTPGAANKIEQGMASGAQDLTYQPRTPSGQSQAATVGNAMQQLIPLMGVAGDVGAAMAPAAMARTAAADAARSGVSVARESAPAAIKGAVATVADAARRVMPSDAKITPGTLGSAGAAATDVATMRRAAAQDLPVPINLTRGQAERTFEQQRFERETAKNPEIGAPIRERMADQNKAMEQNVDAFIDQTGAQAPTLRAAGVVVDDAVNMASKADKTEIRVAYNRAERAGEMESPVSMAPLVQHLNESAPEATTAPLIKTARDLAVHLGLAVDDAGTLIPREVTLKIAEQFRQAINRSTDAEKTNIRQAAIIKGLVDQATEGTGGMLYQKARALRARFAQNYENHAVIADILKSKRGTTDRAVALEDIHRRAILDGSLDDVRQMRRVLHRSGEPGHQAWRELQGQTLKYIKDQAFGNVARDEHGHAVLSPAKLDRAIKSLDADGKLDFIFGKSGAEKLRTFNDLAKDIYTSPPGAVNTSNTASVLMAALDMTLSAQTGLPLPVASGLRYLASKAKNQKLRARVENALASPRRN